MVPKLERAWLRARMLVRYKAHPTNLFKGPRTDSTVCCRAGIIKDGSASGHYLEHHLEHHLEPAGLFLTDLLVGNRGGEDSGTSVSPRPAGMMSWGKCWRGRAKCLCFRQEFRGWGPDQGKWRIVHRDDLPWAVGDRGASLSCSTCSLICGATCATDRVVVHLASHPTV